MLHSLAWEVCGRHVRVATWASSAPTVLPSPSLPSAPLPGRDTWRGWAQPAQHSAFCLTVRRGLSLGPQGAPAFSPGQSRVLFHFEWSVSGHRLSLGFWIQEKGPGLWVCKPGWGRPALQQRALSHARGCPV